MKKERVTPEAILVGSLSFRNIPNFWGDVHGQSAEILGTNNANDNFTFGRDKAFLDICAHQGNDFQITVGFWRDLNQITVEFNEPGQFFSLPGFEWPVNTSLRGDQNIMFSEEGRVIRHSSHALIEEKSDAYSACYRGDSLFKALTENREWDVVCFAQFGGRYADVVMTHDGRFEQSVEVHSAWGAFEWIVGDAFRMGYRFGIFANSDVNKGRPGASYPGTGWFVAIGGEDIMSPPLGRTNVDFWSSALSLISPSLFFMMIPK